MATRILVGGLPEETTDNELFNLFATHGAVELANITQASKNGKTKAFGIVTMTNADEAQKAITHLHGRAFVGQKLNVSQARPQQDHDSWGDVGYKISYRS